MDTTHYVNRAYDMVILYAPKLLLAAAVLVAGLWVIKFIHKALVKAMSLGKLEPSLQSFLGSISNIILKVLLFISVASMVGIATTSFVAILGAAGLAVGLALQNNLANFAGGVLILLFKPFKVGDVISAQGFTGKVSEIGIFHTVIKTSDNKTIIIPNGPLSGGSITNVSTEPQRRLDLTFGIAENGDIQHIKAIFLSMFNEDSRILKTPAPAIKVIEIAEAAIKMSVFLWCNAADYAALSDEMPETAKNVFTAKGIKITYP
ncbi:mechanosensitive ion channel family protein [Candidatus Magnetominusculus xianensis]|uniref:Mechanosensitive ion channel protein MscS n=1 Tax=Candidatus Magnetominusculus xianensis TaxID=1748249 RepID=A0ABR5SBM8_9BACT|nr:mechanosensitive ion channel domain-containing protein [Candidatus Magnetominusculus xianensis]KWT78191.1 mechanosensitive ion channel protein MscS [Candidatus Magnetominusculus xianensis]MBF0402857.1 mechanosensitive ion channel [Nitrospirota bacterium]